MEFKQARVSDIIESERQMVLSAPERFGYFHDNAMGTGYLLGHGVVGMPHHRSLVARWCSQLKKYHLLAIFSFVRLHQVQGLMNLRQVLRRPWMRPSQWRTSTTSRTTATPTGTAR